MKKKNSLVKILVIFGLICAAAVAIAAIISRMQNKLASSCEIEDDEDEGCTGNCSDCSFCDTEDVEDETEEEECEETENLSETAPAEEDK